MAPGKGGTNAVLHFADELICMNSHAKLVLTRARPNKLVYNFPTKHEDTSVLRSN